MTEIKFRAWDKYNKRMIRFYDAMFINPDSEGRNTTTRMLCEYSFRYINSESNILKYLQYTGLKDKNGKEIYVGDIFNVTDGDEWVVGIHVAKMNADTLGIDGRCIDEIIGNIYENPELLEYKG